MGIFIMLSVQSAMSGEIILKGTYQGRDLYISNPHLSSENLFCIRKIHLNGQPVITEPESSVCRVILSHFRIGQPIVVRVEYSGECLPEFLNPQVVGNKDPVSFVEIDIDQSQLIWSINGISGRILFFIEKRIDNQWIILNSLEVESDGGNIRCDYPVEHDKGYNQYRIRAFAEGNDVYSEIVFYESDIHKISFYPKRVSEKITLTAEKDYEILDVRGNSIIKGRESEIWVTNLNPGIYYLVINDKIEKFLKK